MNKREETYHMTDKEMARLIVAERLMEGEIRVKDASKVCALPTRRGKSYYMMSMLKVLFTACIAFLLIISV